MISSILEYSVDFWLGSFNPNYHSIYVNDSTLVKKIKAMSFIKYHIQHDNYKEAYSYFHYLDVSFDLNF
jgi:hypothetical protein